MKTDSLLKTREDYLKEFLNFFWLRPENALMLAIRAEKYAAELLVDSGQDRTIIDISCGDGVFSFITAGGELAENTDMFQAIDNTRKRVGSFDAFDFFEESYTINKKKLPKIKVTTGTDWKDSLLKKAGKLDFYENLIQHDNNKPLPVASETYDLTYSNSTYWVENFEAHLKDLSRITRPGGKIVLEIKTDNIKQFNSMNYAQHLLGVDACEILDAGRLGTWKGLRSYSEVERILSCIPSTHLVRAEPIYGGLLAQIWDIGLRPLFNPLTKMASNCPEHIRQEAKKEWNEIFLQLSSQYIRNYCCSMEEAIEWIFVLEKNS